MKWGRQMTEQGSPKFWHFFKLSNLFFDWIDCGRSRWWRFQHSAPQHNFVFLVDNDAHYIQPLHFESTSLHDEDHISSKSWSIQKTDLQHDQSTFATRSYSLLLWMALLPLSFRAPILVFCHQLTYTYQSHLLTRLWWFIIWKTVDVLLIKEQTSPLIAVLE